MQKKLFYAGRVATSFGKAAELIENLADLKVPAKTIERLTRALGTERVAQRDQDVAAWQQLPLTKRLGAAEGVASPDLAVIFVDGGRLQIRERTPSEAAGSNEVPGEADDWEAEEKPEKGFWREDKIALLAEMASEHHQADPCPEIPQGFLDLTQIPQLVRQIGKVAAGLEDDDASGEIAPSGANEAAYEPPEATHRRVLGSTRSWSVFALMVARAAWAAGFQESKRQAFVADGSANNWRLQARFFGAFIPILDFIHALSYVYAAALAGRTFTAGWECYQRWITWVWQGEVSKVIKELQQRQKEVGEPRPGESATSVASVVARSLTYLRNHQDKMKYDEYRQQGLPITSSLMESVVKQMNYRVKSTEKFWCGQGAEAIVQVCADHLNEDQPLDDFLEQRQAAATGQRPYRRAA